MSTPNPLTPTLLPLEANFFNTLTRGSEGWGIGGLGLA